MDEKEGYRRLTHALAGAASVVIMWMIVASAYGAFPTLHPLVVAAMALAAELIFTMTKFQERRSNQQVIVTQMFFATWVVLFVAEHQRGMASNNALPLIATAVLGAALIALVWTILYVVDGFRQSSLPGI